MNWREIKKKYPKAYRKLRKWVYLLDPTWYNNISEQYDNKSDARYEFIQTLNNHTDCVFNQHRDLYDFFDEQDLIIQIHYNREFSFSTLLYTNYDPYNGEYFYYRHYKTRTHAEQEAFTKAFELLEERLR